MPFSTPKQFAAKWRNAAVRKREFYEYACASADWCCRHGETRAAWHDLGGDGRGTGAGFVALSAGGGAIYLFGIEPNIVFGQLYYSETWQTIFAIDNSVFLWSALLGFALWRRLPWAIAFAGAGLIHLLLDFPLHHDDGRAHFWPLTAWVYESPLSYWDRGHGAGWIGPVEGALSAIAAVRLWMWRPGLLISVSVALLLAAELMVSWVWVFVFGA